jgi:hypothetical protein
LQYFFFIFFPLNVVPEFNKYVSNADNKYNKFIDKPINLNNGFKNKIWKRLNPNKYNNIEIVHDIKL